MLKSYTPLLARLFIFQCSVSPSLVVVMALAFSTLNPLFPTLGSKQGITCPPGNAAYNVSKAAVKTLTEQLAHELRTAESTCSAHLFIPGWTWSAMTGNDGIKEKPSGAWTAEQTVEYMLTKVDKGAFYVVCPVRPFSPFLIYVYIRRSTRRS